MQKLYNETSVENIAKAIRSRNWSRLPQNYQEVEFLQSTGNQYIDINYTLSNKNSYEICLSVQETNTNNKMIFGARKGANEKNMSVNCTSEITIDFNSSSYSPYRASYKYSQGTKYILYNSKEKRYIADIDKNILAINNTKCEDEFITEATAQIFRINPPPQNTWKNISAKLYYCKIWENENLIRELIPCYEKNTNVSGLYDLVTNTFFTKLGTENFIVGENIEPKFKIYEMPEAIKKLPNIRNYEKALENQFTNEIEGNLPLKIENAIDLPFKNINIKGKHEQDSYSGKNLLSSGVLTNVTQNGVTISCDGNGKYTVKGTSTNAISLDIDLQYPITLPTDKNLYLHLRNNVPSHVYIKFSGINYQPELNPADRISTSDKMNLGRTITKISIILATGNTVDIEFQPSIELTDEVTLYEPYVGGMPSPNPEFPSEIKIVKDNANILIQNDDKTEEKSIIIPIQKEMLEEDYLDFKSNQEIHKWKKHIFNGTENIGITTAGYFTLKNINDYDVGKIDIAYSNYYKFNVQALTASAIPYINNTISFSTNTSSAFQYVWVIDNRFTTIDEFKNWLSEQYENGTPLIIYYKLAKTENITFSNEQKEISEKIKNIEIYSDITYIDSNDEIKPTAKIEYYLDKNFIRRQILDAEIEL